MPNRTKLSGNKREYIEHFNKKEIVNFYGEVVDFKLMSIANNDTNGTLTYGQTNITLSEKDNKYLFILEKNYMHLGTNIAIRSYDKIACYNIIIYKYCSFDKEGFYFYPNEQYSLPEYLSQEDREYKFYISNPYTKPSFTTAFKNEDEFYCSFNIYKYGNIKTNLTVDITYDDKDDIKDNQLNLMEINENKKKFFIINLIK